MTRQEELRDLVALIEGEGQTVTAEAIVERAKNIEDWPLLHAHFWEVSEAELAQEARVQRAHRLLIMLRVTVAETGSTTRFMVHARGSSGYTSMPAAQQKTDLMLIKLRQLHEDVGRARARFNSFRAALPDDLADEIEAVLLAAEQATTPRSTRAREGEEAAA